MVGHEKRVKVESLVMISVRGRIVVVTADIGAVEL